MEGLRNVSILPLPGFGNVGRHIKKLIYDQNLNILNQIFQTVFIQIYLIE
jgi:hypothetical protein